MPCRRWLLVVLVAVALLSSGSARAQFRFGNDEQINFIQDVTLKSTSEEGLYLAYMTRTLNIFGGVYVEDLGYVLGVRGDGKKFYDMPEGQNLARFQRDGYLPDPLPSYRLSFLDYFIGYSLWWMLFLFAILMMWNHYRKNTSPVASSDDAPRPPNVTSC